MAIPCIGLAVCVCVFMCVFMCVCVCVCVCLPAELSVGRYRTEKPSKSPPPPPPRRSYPSAHGLTTNRSGELILTPKTAKVP